MIQYMLIMSLMSRATEVWPNGCKAHQAHPGIVPQGWSGD
jgi:hypothetical protein